MTPAKLTCTVCGQEFELTSEYRDQFGGQTTSCQCGNPLQIPPAPPQNEPIQLSYSAPAISTNKLPAGAWREGKALIIQRGVRLPHRCATCGIPVTGTFRPTRLKYTPRASIGLASIGLIGSLVAEQLTQTVTIRFGYCSSHAPWIMPRTARLVRIISILLIAPFFVAASFAGQWHSILVYPFLALGIFAIFVPFYLFFKTEPIEIGAIDNHHAWLVGFGEEYLKLFPLASAQRNVETARTAKSLDEMSENS